MNRLDTPKEAQKLQIKIFREMGPERRLQMGLDLAGTSRSFLAAGIRMRHPDYTEQQIKIASPTSRIQPAG